jgi:hypothetical protein
VDANEVSTYIGLAFGAAGIALGYYQYRKSRVVRRLTCFTRAVSNIRFDVNPELLRGTARQKLMVMFGTRVLDAVSIVHAKIQNTGAEPITKDQIEEPITFIMPSRCELLHSEIVEKSPQVSAQAIQNPDQNDAF